MRWRLHHHTAMARIALTFLMVLCAICFSQGKVDVCKLPMNAGICNFAYKVWAFNATANRCVSFYYTGCGDLQHYYHASRIEHRVSGVGRRASGIKHWTLDIWQQATGDRRQAQAARQPTTTPSQSPHHGGMLGGTLIRAHGVGGEGVT
ncbi:hypothetical protein TcWFU_007688 [Taenia crassiceps]|uniref:BPTI/Kunitz inhibitor domain-containing protein n=1 Tax=Taenia crassiceps TaxID=6207 RepID=A0ABR4QBG2_9CEST